MTEAVFVDIVQGFSHTNNRLSRQTQEALQILKRINTKKPMSFDVSYHGKIAENL